MASVIGILLYLAILLFILMPSATIYSQVADISSIGSLIGGVENTNPLIILAIIYLFTFT